MEELLKEAAERRRRREVALNVSKPPDLLDDIIEPSHSRSPARVLSELNSQDHVHPLRKTCDVTSSLFTKEQDIFTAPTHHKTTNEITALFIEIQCQSNSGKALIHTATERSLISEDFCTKCGLVPYRLPGDTGDRTHHMHIHVMNRPYHGNFSLAMGCPDVILGMDFLTKNKCIVDLESRCVRVGGSSGVLAPILSDRDIPLKFRYGTGESRFHMT